MHFNSLTLLGKITTSPSPCVDEVEGPGIKFEMEVIDRYHKSYHHRESKLTTFPVFVYKKSIVDFSKKLNVGDRLLIHGKLGNVDSRPENDDHKIGLILSQLGELILMDKYKWPIPKES